MSSETKKRSDNFLKELYYDTRNLEVGEYANSWYPLSLSNMEFLFDLLSEKKLIDKFKPVENNGENENPYGRSDREQLVFDKIKTIKEIPFDYFNEESSEETFDCPPPLLVNNYGNGGVKMYLRKDLIERLDLDSLEDYPAYSDDLSSDIETEAQYHSWIEEDAEMNFQGFFDKNNEYFLGDEYKDEIYSILERESSLESSIEGTSVFTIIPSDCEEIEGIEKYLQKELNILIEQKEKLKIVDEVKKQAKKENKVIINAPRI